MAQIEIVVIGASAGGLETLIEIFSGLPPALRGSVLVVVHTMSDGTSYLPRILSRQTKIAVAFAENNAPIERGHVYIAPPDTHLLVERGKMCLSHGPKENGFRPAVDPLFRSASRAYGAGVMGIILSGALDDGTYGMKVIKDHGGTTVVQDPDEASQPGMILSAQRYVTIDHVLRAKEIAGAIARCCGSVDGKKGKAAMSRPREPEPQHESEETDVHEMEEDFGAPSALTCPDCGGALWEIRDGKLSRYRCHVGHQFTLEGLDGQQRNSVEAALWTAVRALEERAELRTRMSERAAGSAMDAVAQGFAESAREAQQQAATIRELLFGHSRPAPPETKPKPVSRRKGKTRRRRR